MSAKETPNENYLGIFKNLELIPLLLEKVELLENEITILKQELMPKLDLSKRANVRKFLDVSEGTLMNMMKDGRLKNGIHYKREIKGKRTTITFLGSAIIKMKGKK